MASTKAWIDALNKIMPVSYPDFKTAEIYSRIRQLGFQTVKWSELETKNDSEDEINALLAETEKFVSQNKPCLFIFDPKDSSVRKGYFEFVKGTHLGKKGIFVTGFEQASIFQFPHVLQEAHSIQASKRCKATAIKNP